MVQVTRGLPDSRFEVLGDFGNSLSDVLQNFMIDKSINKIKNNPDFANAPASERLEKLTGALGRHGPTGQKRLQDYLLVEQQRETEKERGKAERKEEKEKSLASDIQNKIQNAGSIEEKVSLISQLPVNAQKPYLSYINAELKRQSQQAESQDIDKILNPNSGSFNQNINSQLQNTQPPFKLNEEMNSDQINPINKDKYSESGFNPPFSNEQIQAALRSNKQQLARNMQSSNKQAFQEFQGSSEQLRNKEISSGQAKADVAYNSKLQQQAAGATDKIRSLYNLQNLNAKGVTGKPYEKLLEKTGLISITADGRREFAAETKNLYTDFKAVAGSQLTGFEFQTLMNAYPSADFSKSANEAIIKNNLIAQESSLKKSEIGNKLIEENGGKIPIDFERKVTRKYKEYVDSKIPEMKKNLHEFWKSELPPGKVLMLDPIGDPLQVDKGDEKRWEKLGATYP